MCILISKPLSRENTDLSLEKTNLGTVFTNLGTVFTNLGTVFTNLGTVFTNLGTVFTNLGPVFYEFLVLPFNRTAIFFYENWKCGIFISSSPIQIVQYPLQ